MKKWFCFLWVAFAPILVQGESENDPKLLIRTKDGITYFLYKVYRSGLVSTSKIHFNEKEFPRVRNFVLSPDEKTIVLARTDNSLWVYDIEKKKQEKVFECPFEPKVDYYLMAGQQEYTHTMFNGTHPKVISPKNTDLPFYIGSTLKDEIAEKTTRKAEADETLKNEGDYDLDLKTRKYHRLEATEAFYTGPLQLVNGEFLLFKPNTPEGPNGFFLQKSNGDLKAVYQTDKAMGSPDISRDGSKLVFVGVYRSKSRELINHEEIVEVDLAAAMKSKGNLSESQKFETVISPEEKQGGYQKPRLSPSGKKIAYLHCEGNQKGFDLLVDGTHVFHFDQPAGGYLWLDDIWLNEDVLLVTNRNWFSVVDVNQGKILSKTDFQGVGPP